MTPVPNINFCPFSSSSSHLPARYRESYAHRNKKTIETYAIEA